ncbi:MAG: ABC transporter permease [Bacteroidota bacterium]
MKFSISKSLGITLALFPLLFLLGLSLMAQWSYPELSPQEWTLLQWKRLWGGSNGLRSSLSLSLGLSLGVASFATGLGFFSSRVIAYHPQKALFRLLAYFPFVLTPVIYAACVYYFFIRLGLNGQIWGVLLAQLMIAYPYAVILGVEFWNERMKDLINLAYTLGANERATWMRVIWPASRGILLLIFFQTFLISWFEYGLTTLIGVGKVQTLTVKVFQFIHEANPYLAALSGLLLAFPPILLLWINRRFVFKTQLT